MAIIASGPHRKPIAIPQPPPPHSPPPPPHSPSLTTSQSNFQFTKQMHHLILVLIKKFTSKLDSQQHFNYSAKKEDMVFPTLPAITAHLTPT